MSLKLKWLNHSESIPRRIRLVLKAKGGLTYYKVDDINILLQLYCVHTEVFFFLCLMLTGSFEH